MLRGKGSRKSRAWEGVRLSDKNVGDQERGWHLKPVTG